MIQAAFYNTKEYDKPSFEQYGSQHGVLFRFLETKLNEDTVELARGDDAELGDTVAVVDTSRDPEWRLTARVVKRVRTFGEGVAARVTIGTVEPVDYVQVSALAADVATLQNDVVGNARFAHYGNLTTAASVTVVESTVTEAIDDLDELADIEF